MSHFTSTGTDYTAYENEAEREEREAAIEGLDSWGPYDYAGRPTAILHGKG